MSYYTDIQYSSKSNKKIDLTLEYVFDIIIKKREFNNVLELGCGFFVIDQYINAKNLVGVDIDKDLLRHPIKNYLVIGNITSDLPFKEEKFDLIFGSHIIEHVYDPLFVAKQAYKLLSKNGYLILITPDWIYRYNSKKKNFYDDYTHKTPFTKKSIDRLLYDAGFKNRHVFNTFWKFKGLGRLHNLLKQKGIYKHYAVLYYFSKKDILYSTDIIAIGKK